MTGSLDKRDKMKSYFEQVKERLIAYKDKSEKSAVLIGEESGVAYQTIYGLLRNTNLNPAVRTVEKLDTYLKSLGA